MIQLFSPFRYAVGDAVPLCDGSGAYGRVATRLTGDQHTQWYTVRDVFGNLRLVSQPAIIAELEKMHNARADTAHRHAETSDRQWEAVHAGAV